MYKTGINLLNVLGCFCLVGFLAACSQTSSPTGHAVVTPSPTAQQLVIPTFTPPTSCQAASPVDNSSMGPEVQGTAINAQLWALIMSSTGIPVEAKQQVKIVWRMTGSGDIHFSAYNSNGRHITPVWGPEVHGGSNWNRPGDEWGTGFTFPASGCWDIHVTRDNAAGDVWLDVH